jgi:Fic family protein
MSTPYDRTQPYNQLPLLPPDNNVIDHEVLLKWGLASRALAELSANILRLPNPTMLVNTISLQEARSSTAIENIFTTEDELYKATSDSSIERNQTPNTKEVLRYREALWTGYQKIKDTKIIDKEVMIKVFQQVKDTTEGIRSPQSFTVINRGNSEYRGGEVIYTPPRGKGIIAEKIDNLVEYLNNQQNFPTDPLLKMAIAHYQFEAIHPFSDGNGRTGRILNLLYLVSQGLISQPVLYLSKYIIENKADYYYSLGAVTQQGSWKKWILFMLSAVEQTSRNTNRMINEIINQMAATLEHGKSELKWYTKEVNEALFYQPYIKQQTLAKVTKTTSRVTLTKYMSELHQAGILFPKKDGKEVYYLNNDLIRILES